MTSSTDNRSAAASAAARSALPSASALNDSLGEASPAAVIEAALRRIGRDRLALVSSFGTGCSRRRSPIATH